MKKEKKEMLLRIDSILKGLIDYKKDKKEYERIQKKYEKINADFINYEFPKG